MPQKVRHLLGAFLCFTKNHLLELQFMAFYSDRAS